MAKTLLQATNEVGKRVGFVRGSSGEFTSLTDSARQGFLDRAGQVIREGIDELYTLADRPYPSQVTEATITLVTSDRDYALASDLNTLHWPFLDETNGRYIQEYPGGYLRLVNSQLQPGNFTGIPELGAIRPTDGQVYLDRLPTASENGLIYKYRYDKDFSIDAATDTVPFEDAVFNAMIPVWAILFMNQDDGTFRRNLARAAKLMTRETGTRSYLTRPVNPNPTDPFVD